MKNALVTGATSGIGRAIAFKLAALGYHLILTGRRNERLNNLSLLIKEKHKIDVHTICFDIRNNEETLNAIQSIPSQFRPIQLLVNNAGLAAGADAFQEAQWSDWDTMIDTNVKGLLYISKLIIPQMIEQQAGHVINIASISGHNVYAGGSVYCASKAAVRSISEGMRIDLLKHNIKVSVISPGMVETEFSLVRYKGNQAVADNVYKGLTPLSADDIADAMEYIVTRPPHVCINEMLIMPTAQANAYYNHRI